MRYADELISEIRTKNDIVEVISAHVKLVRKGQNHWGVCPFHNEKTPSFSVSESKQMYYCFGCGASGNVFTFLMNYENNTFLEAVEELARRAGVELPTQERTPQMREIENHRARLYAVNKEAATYFYHALREPTQNVGMRYLEKRGLNSDTMKKFGLGYADKIGNHLLQHLRKLGYEDALLIEAGLARFSDKTGVMSQFWNRVMFPIQDVNRRVIGFGGRVMGEGEPKYLNSPETPIFDKRKNLYALGYAKAKHGAPFILCEGYLDVIALHQAGFIQSVASLGTAFGEQQAALLKRYTDTVLIAYDSDEAGRRATLRAITILKEAGLTAKVLDLLPAKDPDEFIQTQGKEAFEERMREAQNSFFFELALLQKQYRMQDPAQRTAFHQEIAKKLLEFTEEVERENYIRAAAGFYEIRDDSLRKLVAAYANRGLGNPQRQERSESRSPKKEQEDPIQTVWRYLLGWLASEPKLYPQVAAFLSPQDFGDGFYATLAQDLFTRLDQVGESFYPADLISLYTDPLQQKEAASALQAVLPTLATKAEREKAFKDLMIRVKQYGSKNAIWQAKGATNLQVEIKRRKEVLDELGKTNISLD
jgi:DNA primase